MRRGNPLIYSAAWKHGGVGALTMRAAGTLHAPFAWERRPHGRSRVA
jgi:hypothetical protein